MNESSGAEVLIVLAEGETGRPREALERLCPVLHAVSSRLLIVREPPGGLRALAEMAGILAATKGDLPPEVLDRLDATEKLWVAAWRSRDKPKTRPGDGLSWDAPGFRRPDRGDG
jgi:hypothetical protein